MTKTQTRSGRQVETTTTHTLHAPFTMIPWTPLTEDGREYRIVALVNNVRHYDGELSQDNYWAVTAEGGHISISKSDFDGWRENDHHTRLLDEYSWAGSV